MTAAAVAPTARGPRPLKGPDRVAALLMAMGKPAAARVMRHFNADEIRMVTRSIAELRPVNSTQLEALVEDFASQFGAGASLVGNADAVEKLLSGILDPDEVRQIMNDVLGSQNHSIWDRISQVAEQSLASYLVKEHPQTAALILSKVKSGCAAKVMAHLPSELRSDLTRRMLTFKPIVDETMQIIEKTIHEDFMMNFSRNAGSDTHARMADIINKMERDQMEEVLEDLAQSKPKSAEILKGLLFTFDDIIRLTPRARTTLFDQVPNEKVVVALKGANPEFRDIILQSLASRVRRMVEQEIQNSEASSQRDIAEARRLITDLALEMAGRGEIELGDPDDDGYMN
ncbi:flagellar motor switch protein FliG [Amorphus sp. 3PC139-8]|uniref:flagellar motor switch protein FliG n=1 Tax=Amorphus sp. 3PC139-8 TaxID=2735676 RepID=UPI00345C80A0